MADADPGAPQGEATATQAPPQESPQAADARKAKRRRILLAIAGAIVVLALLYGVYWFLTQRGRVSTDNAYVGAESAQVTPLVAAAVKDVRVTNTQAVKAGDVLVVLDDADARVDVATAEANLRQAEQRFLQSAATVQAAQGRLSAQGAGIQSAQANLRQADAQLARARSEYNRRQALAGTGAVAGEELTTARTALAQAKAARSTAAAAVATAQSQRTAAAGDVASAAAVVRGNTPATAPDVAAARARLDQAKLNLERTVIRAPIAGVVTSKTVQIGQRVAPGVAIMTIVPTERVYVDANFKEDQFRRIRIGQPATLTSDFYGGNVVFHGKVVGYAGGTGAAFSLIPAQNATGNWIKVVQRLPVRIALDPNEVRAHPLRVGLSMEASVDTRGE